MSRVEWEEAQWEAYIVERAGIPSREEKYPYDCSTGDDLDDMPAVMAELRAIADS